MLPNITIVILSTDKEISDYTVAMTKVLPGSKSYKIQRKATAIR
jgi:hypothetical protein